MDGEGTQTGTASFEVRDKHLVVQGGDNALGTDNLTVDDAGEVPAAAIDSRAGGDFTDPVLYRTIVADALDEDSWPLVVVSSTPVYCLSQFCGVQSPTRSQSSPAATRTGRGSCTSRCGATALPE